MIQSRALGLCDRTIGVGFLVLVLLLPHWLHPHSLLCILIFLNGKPGSAPVSCFIHFSLPMLFPWVNPSSHWALNNTYMLITPKLSLLPGPLS